MRIERKEKLSGRLSKRREESETKKYTSESRRAWMPFCSLSSWYCKSDFSFSNIFNSLLYFLDVFSLTSIKFNRSASIVRYWKWKKETCWWEMNERTPWISKVCFKWNSRLKSKTFITYLLQELLNFRIGKIFRVEDIPAQRVCHLLKVTARLNMQINH